MLNKIRPVKLAVGISLMTIVACAASGDTIEERREVAKRYVSLPSQQQMIDDMLGVDVMRSSLDMAIPPELGVSDSALDQAAQVIADRVQAKKPELLGVMVEAAAQNFTVEELEAVIDFYTSPVGDSVSRKMGAYMVDVNQLMTPMIMEVQKAAEPQLMEIFMSDME
ncbi:DUF2059 domain-containing protein [Paracoccaceae bacterium GXU_MW_L88]